MKDTLVVKKATPLGARVWTSLLVFGFIGQIAWMVENVYFSTYIQKNITAAGWATSATVAASAIAAAPVSQTIFKILLPFICICASVGAVSVSEAVCTGYCVLSVCGARRFSGAVSRCTAAGTSGTAFITLTGLLTSETGSKSRSAASSQSGNCRRGLL